MDRVLSKRHKNEIFNVLFEFEHEITSQLIVSIFILMNKYYSSLIVLSADWNVIDVKLKWEDFILKGYQLTSEYDFLINLEVPIYLQEESDGEESIVYFNAIDIYYGLEESTNRNCFGINFYSNTYTDVRYDWDVAKKNTYL